tara:strand:+ start:83 stop:1126 length:1044 start_codon:yes stop_codon:yes gene_type:complete
MKKRFRSLILILSLFFISLVSTTYTDDIEAQDIPELHMLVLQGDIFISGSPNSEVDGLILNAKIGNTIVGSVPVADQTTTSRYVSLEIGPYESLEGQIINFTIGNQIAAESIPFGPTTPSGTYCKGCSWVLPLSIKLDLNFSAFPQATPTPVPASAAPAFLTGNVIFGSVLSAPAELNVIEAYIGDELVGTGTVNGPDFSITIDPGTVEYVGKEVTFVIAGTNSKTTYTFVEDDFQVNSKLFFPQYIPPTPTATPIPLATAVPVPTATPVPEPTRTPTPIPEPTPTYTPTATPTPIIISSNTAQNDLIISESSDGGCNSRGGGPASVGLIILSLAPVYLLNRKRKFK